MRKAAWVLAPLLTATACATGYQVDGFTGGQRPNWRAVDVLEVSSLGNGFTRDSRLREMTLLRAAESAIEANYRYFIEIDSENTGGTDTIYMPETQTTTTSASFTGSSYNSFSTTTFGGGPTSVYKPGVDAVYRMFDELPADARPGQFYDAYDVYNEYGRKYLDRFEPLTPPRG